MSFPSPITALKLRVSVGTETHEQTIPSASLGNNSMQIMQNTVVFNAFNNNPPGTIFTPSMVTSYGSDELGNAVSMVSTPSVVANFVPKQIIPNLSIANISNKLTTDSPFSVSVTSPSDGLKTYSSSHPQIASIDSSSGLITLVGTGTTTIFVSQAASANGVYTAAGPVSTQLVVDKTVPNLSIANISNKLTTDSPFSVSVTSPSDGLKTYSSSHPQIASIDSSSGLITLVGTGTTTIFVSQAASANGVYTAAGPVSTQLVVDKTVPNLSIANISNKLTTDSPFSVSVTSPSDGLKTYSSSHPQIASIDSSSGLITLVGTGTTTIFVSQAASANGVYTAAGPVSTQLVVSFPKGFSVITDSDFASLDFNSGMTTLFPSTDDNIFSITMPNSNFIFNSAAYTTLYASSNGWFSFGKLQTSSGSSSNQQPTETLRYFGWDHVSTGSYKFVSNNTRLLFKLTGYPYNQTIKTFTIKVIIEQSGEIRINYTLASTFILNNIIIGFVGNNSSITSDDNFLTLNGSTFNGATALDLFSLLNGRTSLYIAPKYTAFGPFSLPTDIQLYRNQTITRVLTPPTSNSLGAFTFTSSNNAVATISISGGVYSINVIGGGTTTITAIQAASGDYASSSVTASLSVTVVLPTFGSFTLPSHELIYQSQTITRVLTPPTSNSSGAFTFTSSNTDVATISINGGVSSINVIGGGTSIITATQSASGDFASSSSSIILDTIKGTVFGTIWRQIGADIDGEAAGDQSGTSVSLSSDGTIVAIGAIYNVTSLGHARVYKYNPTKTVAQLNQSLAGFGSAGWDRLGGDIDGEAANNYSGWSVSLSSDGNIVAIGANYNSGNGYYAGHVRVYIRDTTVPLGWRQLGGDIDGEAAFDYSGYSVSLSSDGTTLAIGAQYNDGNGSDSGHVRVYKYNSSKSVAQLNQSLAGFGPAGWDRLGGDIDGEAVGDQSGISVSLSSDGTIVAIGAQYNDGNGSNSGHVRVYKYNSSKSVAQLNQSLAGFGPVGWDRLGGDIDGEAANDLSGYSVDLSSDGTTLAIGAYYNDGNGSDSGHVRVYKYNSSKSVAQLNQSLAGFGPVGWDRLGGDIDGEAANDYSGYSVSLSSDGTTLAIGAQYNDGNGSDSGHVRVYKYNSSKSVAQLNQSLAGFGPAGWDRLGGDIDGEAVGDQSGYSVSLSSDGTTLAIGAPYNDGNGNNSGHVRVYSIINYPTFGSFTLSSDIQVYQNQITTRVLTPPTSNSLGAFTFTSSNTAVATISLDINGVSSINVIGTGTTTITAIQAASSSYRSSSVTASLTVIPMLSLADLPVKLTIDSSFSLSDFVTNNSTGVLSYESSAPSVATVNSSSGLVTLAGAGTTTITVSVAASSDGLYAAASVTRQLVVIMPITLAANGVTIQYTLLSIASEPRFIQANPRGNGMEWFAVVTNNSSAQITSYAKSAGSAVSAYFTPPGQSDPVLFKNIVTSLMTNMSDLFYNAGTFDQDISSWDTSKVINMSSMFNGATLFNNGGDISIGSWDTSSVTNMSFMFSNAEAFNKNIGSWVTSSVTNMSYMFNGATLFNNGGSSSIGNWNTSSVTNMSYMFYGAAAFNKPISSWDTSKVTNMNSMFQGASLFNQNISGWDVSFVSLKPPTDFSTSSALIAANTPVWFPITLTLAANLVTIQYTLTSIATEPKFIRANPRGAAQPEWFAVVTNASKSQITSYAKSTGSAVSAYFTPPGQSNPVPFNNIVTTLMTDMINMFYEATTFNQPIGSWDTSKVTNMNSVFQYAYIFNQNIGSWNTALVTSMVSMFFGASVFNQNIGSWNTSKVTNMISMFYYAEAFNQNISVWNVSLVSPKPPPNFSTGSPLTAANTPVWFQ